MHIGQHSAPYSVTDWTREVYSLKQKGNERVLLSSMYALAQEDLVARANLWTTARADGPSLRIKYPSASMSSTASKPVCRCPRMPEFDHATTTDLKT